MTRAARTPLLTVGYWAAASSRTKDASRRSRGDAAGASHAQAPAAQPETLDVTHLPGGERARQQHKKGSELPIPDKELAFRANTSISPGRERLQLFGASAGLATATHCVADGA